MTSISNIWKQLTSILSNLNNFHSLEVVDRVSETQLQVGENSDRIINLAVKGLMASTTSQSMAQQSLRVDSFIPRHCPSIHHWVYVYCLKSEFSLMLLTFCILRDPRLMTVIWARTGVSVTVTEINEIFRAQIKHHFVNHNGSAF